MPARRKPSSDALPAGKTTALAKSYTTVTVHEEAAFEEIVGLIEQSRLQAVRAVNTTLIDLYWKVREVARQMDAALFERSLLNPPKLSTVLRELHPQAAEFFKDVYSLEFLGLPADHS